MQKKQTIENKRGRKLRILLFFFLLTLTASTLGVFCLNEVKNAFLRSNFIWMAAVVCTCSCVLFILSVYLIFCEKDALLKGFISLYVLVIIALTICLILQKTGFLRLVDSPEKLQEYLQKAGVWMPILYIVLQFLQVVVLPIPSLISTIAGVALFGAFGATIYSLIGIFLGSLTAFLIGRKCGNRAVAWMIGEETLKKWQKKLKGKDNLFLTLMFILPLFPDDILCFIAGLSTMTLKYFLIVVFLARFVGVVATCYSIDFIPFTTWWGVTIWVIFALSIAVGVVILYKNLDKIQQFFNHKRKNVKKQ